MRRVLGEREVEHLCGRLGTAGIDRDQVAHRSVVPDPATGDRRAVVGDRRVLGGVGDRVAGPVPVGGGVRQRLILSRRCRGHSYSPTEYSEAAKSSSAHVVRAGRNRGLSPSAALGERDRGCCEEVAGSVSGQEPPRPDVLGPAWPPGQGVSPGISSIWTRDTGNAITSVNLRQPPSSLPVVVLVPPDRDELGSGS